MSIESKLIKLIEELQKAKKQEVKKTPTINHKPVIDQPEDHPTKLSEKEAIRMVKKEMEVCKWDANGQWKIEKGAENPHMGHSSFTMDHVNQVSDMKDHRAAKEYAHKAVDESTANPKNKLKLKAMINGSKNVSHLALGMSNHVLAHPSENLKVGRG